MQANAPPANLVLALCAPARTNPASSIGGKRDTNSTFSNITGIEKVLN